MDSTKSHNEWNIVIRELTTENLGIVLIENSEIKARIDSINIELSNIYPLTQDSTKVEIAADSPEKASFEALFTNMNLYLSIKIPTDTLALEQINN
ncbi:MAG: hypothetical protein KKF62_16830 [Bacteroidetes bacterium]|nr:hypothetical protein [Bacteroidota bacterium]